MAETAQTRGAPADHRKAPRRRGEVLERAIFEATLAELHEAGYLNLSIERVAQRARTGNASIYRRWPSRAELVLEAIRHIVPDREELPDTGTVRGDLLALLRTMAARQAGPTGEVIRGVIAESLGNERIRAARARLANYRNQQVLEILRRGAARGEVRPGALTAQIAGVGPTLLMNHFLLHGAPIPDEVLTSTLDQVVMALISPR
jgi:AcrR family transcriptional regulator